jgi:hypothetical protein
LVYMGTFRQMAGVAADPVVELGLVRNPSPLVHSILALILLTIATILGIYKPFGATAYGQSKQALRHPRPLGETSPLDLLRTTTPRWSHWVWILVIGLIALFIAAHLMSRGAHGH